MRGIKEWMDQNRLKMNPTKTEFILFGNKHQLNKCITQHLNVNGTDIARTTCIKYLGAQMDEQVSMDKHATTKCRAAMINLQRIKLIRKYLTVSACKTLVQGLVVSHLDYANALLSGVPKRIINKLQRVQTRAAKLILGRSRMDSATACLMHLHWLPIRGRIHYKLCLLMYKCDRKAAPKYMTDLTMKKKVMREGNRSNAKCHDYEVPFTKLKTFADRSFGVQGPKHWNELPDGLKAAVNLETFKRDLKTHLFRLYFNLN
jgi:hypothetical protein